MKSIAYLAGAVFLIPGMLMAQGESSGAAPLPVADTMTVWKLMETGGWAMIPLGVLSVITVMLVLVYLFTLRSGAIVSAHYMNTAEVLLKKRDYLGLLAISSKHNDAVARIMNRTLDFISKNPTAELSVIREIAETEGTANSSAMQQRIVYLADIGMLAPMVGLLGTVFGIINSFGTLAHHSTVESNRNALLASGVSQALIATATGLVLGIASMGFYSLFRGRVQRLISDMEIATTHLLSLLTLHYKKKEPSRPNDPVELI